MYIKKYASHIQLSEVIMYTIIKTIFQRIRKEPITSTFFVLGFALAMLMVSMGTSYVTEMVCATNDKKSYAPPNGYQLAVSIFLEEEQKVDMEYMLKAFEETKEKTGIFVNDIMLNLDAAKVNEFVAASAEWFKKDAVWHYPLSQGRYYTREEILERKNVVLIGKNLQKYVEEENNEKYIGIEGTRYKVLGIVGFKDKDSLWDSRLFMPITSLPDKELENLELGSFSCAIYNHKNVVDENIELLEQSFAQRYDNVVIENIGKLETDNAMEQVVTNPDNILLMGILGYLVAVVYAINIVALWMEKRRKEMGVRKAFGYSNLSITKLIMCEMAGLTFLGCIIGLGIQFLLKLFVSRILDYDLTIYISNVVISFGIVAITTLLTSIWPVMKIMKIQPVEIVK